MFWLMSLQVYPGVKDHKVPKTRFLLPSDSCLLTCGALSDKRTGLSFTIVDGPHQCTRLPTLEGQVSVFMSPKTRVAKLYSQALVSLFQSSTTNKAIVEVLKPASTRMISES
jgi:hypothetical protein